MTVTAWDVVVISFGSAIAGMFAGIFYGLTMSVWQMVFPPKPFEGLVYPQEPKGEMGSGVGPGAGGEGP